MSAAFAFAPPFSLGSFRRKHASLACRRDRVQSFPARARRRASLVSSYKRGKCAENQYVYVPTVERFSSGTVVPLPADEQQHLRARRVRSPALVRLFNGRGGSAMATLNDGGGAALVVEEVGGDKESCARRVALDVCLCVPRKPSRADWTVEKLTELGVGSILCVESARSGEPLSDEKLSRLRRICVAAAKQSLQVLVPEVRARRGGLPGLGALTDRYDVCLLLSPDGMPILSVLGKALQATTGSVLIVAGPEGGLSDVEEANLISYGFVRAALGPGRLRVETAVLAATAAVGFAVDALEHENATQ